uniref:Uncharacterized protein n=1 Tax=Trichuris muris TaxID=70415 RepID=A0A5S6QDR6_TRIMR
MTQIVELFQKQMEMQQQQIEAQRKQIETLLSRLAPVFLTNQTTTTFKLLNTLAGQPTPPKNINDLSMSNIVEFMKDQYDSRRFVVRERFRFWSDMKRKPGETIQEMAARIRQEAATCDFASINDPQDEALRTRLICSVGNEAVLKGIIHDKR